MGPPYGGQSPSTLAILCCLPGKLAQSQIGHGAGRLEPVQYGKHTQCQPKFLDFLIVHREPKTICIFPH